MLTCTAPSLGQQASSDRARAGADVRSGPLLRFPLLADIALPALLHGRRIRLLPVPRCSTAWRACWPAGRQDALAGQLADSDGAIRVILDLPPWNDFALSCLDDIITASAGSPLVLVRTQDMLTGSARQFRA